MFNIPSFDDESYNDNPFNNSISEIYSSTIKDSDYNINISNTIKYPLFDDNCPFKEEILQEPLNNIKAFNYETIKEKTTNLQTDQIPPFYSKDDIIDKILNKEIINKLNKVELDFLLLLKKKRKGDELFGVIKKNEEEDKSQKKKRGRKSNKNSIKIHDRKAPDNIIKKIKAITFNYILTFLNNLLKNATKSNIKFIKINYKYVNMLNRNFEFQLLSMKLKDLLSLEMSPKYIKTIGEEHYNQQIIEVIEKRSEDNIENNPYYTLNFVLNITYREWLNLFTGKKNLSELSNDYGFNKNLINFEKIEKSFVGINDLLNTFQEDDDEFIAYFIFLFFNYERWFFIKKARNRKNKNVEI